MFESIAAQLTLTTAAAASLVAFAGVLRGFSGFGSAMVLAPTLAALYPVTVAVPLIVLLEVALSFQLLPDAMRAYFELWREGGLSLRTSVGLELNAGEEEGLAALLAAWGAGSGFGDEWLRFNGLGERVTFGMYNNDAPTDKDKDELHAVARWAAERGLGLTQHWQNARVLDAFLDVVERVNREIPVAPLRWSIAHLNDASDANLARMKALGFDYFAIGRGQVLSP